jgi:hypothetical protein
LLLKRQIPRLALELKWNRGRIDKKDRKSLKAAIETLRLNKAYFLTTCIRRAPFRRMEKTHIDRGRVFEVIVTLDFTPEDLADWKRRRRLYRKEMSLGKVPKVPKAITKNPKPV